MKNSKIGVIIAAAGIGSRMNNSIPKQFIKIEGVPILAKTTKIFANNKSIDSIFIVANPNFIEETRQNLVDFLEKDELNKVKKIVVGDNEYRQFSIFNAIKAIKENYTDIDYVLVHDVARPFLTNEVLDRVIDETLKTGAAIPVVKVKDTIRDGYHSLKKNELKAVQTPQGFEVELLYNALAKVQKDKIIVTDDASAVEYIGNEVSLVKGDYENIKITTREDLPKNMKVGIGYDVHKLVEGRKLVLGGVEIPHFLGLLGHSDADVLIHAVMDAILGAAGLGDIGKLFPDTSDEFKNISSLILLDRVRKELEQMGFVVSNIDCVIICQQPKLASFTEEMKENMSKVLNISVGQINIKCTTTEKLGFCGREEGIAAEAVCMIN